MGTVANRPHLMEVIYSFETGGSETLAADLAAHFHGEGTPVSVCSSHTGPGPISDQLERSGIPCYPLDGENRSRIARRLDLYRLFRNTAVDILHIHHVSLLPLCYWPARLAGVKRIVTTEHNEIFIEQSSRVRRLARHYCPKIEAVTAIHKALLDYLRRELRLPDSKLALIPNGVDTRRFSPGPANPDLRASLGIPEDAVVAGCIGRLHEHKGHGNLLEATKRVLDQHPGFRLLIIGDGPLRPDLEAAVRRDRMGENVHFLGERRDVAGLLGNLDFFVLASETEGVPIVLLEAMSVGVPCVATEVGGVPELIDNTDGRLAPPGDPEKLAKSMLELCGSPATRHAIAANTRRQVMEKYDTRRMLEAYQRLLFEKG